MATSRMLYGTSLVLNYHLTRNPRRRKYSASVSRVKGSSDLAMPTLNALDELDRAFESRSINTERTMGDSSWWDTK
jgi:hypothetical protein